MRVSSNVNGTTACMSHVGGKTGARQVIEGSTEYGAYSWAISGWTWNSGLSLSVASWAIAAKEKTSIRLREQIAKIFALFFSIEKPQLKSGAGVSQSTGTTLLARRLIGTVDTTKGR